ncbi:hypothetical protein V6N11_072278 [Hibiscus sabdariffa]|uniref:Uncharacterized protein n=1 Tax=Hibiscus sabdariffa TaxID=183260 RepID=A0ABR2U2V8_9ROSI
MSDCIYAFNEDAFAFFSHFINLDQSPGCTRTIFGCRVSERAMASSTDAIKVSEITGSNACLRFHLGELIDKELKSGEKKFLLMATETKSNLVKVKSSGQDGSSRAKFDAAINKKKIESSTKQPVDAKQKSVVTKTEVKSKTSSSSSKTTATTKTKVREKKVYTLPGQKHDPPEEREPLRIFYESLSKQIPTSEMAEFWMMEHGLLSPEKARKAYEKKQRRQKQLRAGTPIKPSKPSSKPESSKNGDVKAKKRINNDMDEDEEDFVLSPKRRKG